MSPGGHQTRFREINFNASEVDCAAVTANSWQQIQLYILTQSKGVVSFFYLYCSTHNSYPICQRNVHLSSQELSISHLSLPEESSFDTIYNTHTHTHTSMNQLARPSVQEFKTPTCACVWYGVWDHPSASCLLLRSQSGHSCRKDSRPCPCSWPRTPDDMFSCVGRSFSELQTYDRSSVQGIWSGEEVCWREPFWNNLANTIQNTQQEKEHAIEDLKGEKRTNETLVLSNRGRQI